MSLQAVTASACLSAEWWMVLPALITSCQSESPPFLPPRGPAGSAAPPSVRNQWPCWANSRPETSPGHLWAPTPCFYRLLDDASVLLTDSLEHRAWKRLHVSFISWMNKYPHFHPLSSLIRLSAAAPAASISGCLFPLWQLPLQIDQRMIYGPDPPGWRQDPDTLQKMLHITSNKRQQSRWRTPGRFCNSLKALQPHQAAADLGRRPSVFWLNSWLNQNKSGHKEVEHQRPGLRIDPGGWWCCRSRR